MPVEFHHVEQRRYAQFSRLRSAPGLKHGFSTRPMDVSARDDERYAERAARRVQMARDLGFDPTRLFHTVQVHETQIARIDATSQAGAYPGFDALITSLPGAALMTFSADCPLVMVFDPRRRALGMVHASWRCTVAHASGLLVQALRDAYGCDPRDLLAGIGPSAGPTTYEVKEDVREAAAGLPDRDRLFPRRDGRMFFDLWQANQDELERAGLGPENIEIAGICTISSPEIFYSFRREGPGCGHFGLLAGLDG